MLYVDQYKSQSSEQRWEKMTYCQVMETIKTSHAHFQDLLSQVKEFWFFSIAFGSSQVTKIFIVSSSQLIKNQVTAQLSQVVTYDLS